MVSVVLAAIIPLSSHLHLSLLAAYPTKRKTISIEGNYKYSFELREKLFQRRT
jgi:hypothetical protein